MFAANSKDISAYLVKPNKRVLGFLTGQVIKATAGAANPSQASTLVQQKMEQLQAEYAKTANNTSKS